jgi:PAS domain S-box-containing protein
MPMSLSVLGVRIPERAIERKRVVPVAVVIVAALLVVEWLYKLEFSLGIFYTIPVMIAATALNRIQSVLFGVACACARGLFTPAASELEFFLKFLMAGIAYCGSGLLIVEMSNNRRRIIENYARLKLEQDLRRRAEEQLRILAESSPAAILTINESFEVEAANHAAHEMLGYLPGELIGKPVDMYFPFFAGALQLALKDRPVRTSVTGWARRRHDQIFPIQAWFSVYRHGAGRRLAAIVVDTSEDVRERERETFQYLLDNNRLLAGAVSHEIRNLCSAISVVCSNLSARPDLRNSADFDALNRLVEGLSVLASFKLRQKSENSPPRADLKTVLDQLRVVIEPDWEEIDGAVQWHVPENAPPLAGDAHGLLQIFLNLAQNSLRAVEPMAERRLDIRAVSTFEDMIITFSDTGPGVANPDMLFHPFRPDADGSGLGLYISRELARSFGGDLQHLPNASGAEFRVLVPIAQGARREAAYASN